MRHRLQPWWFPLLLALGLAACSETPRERLASAWAAADDERFDTYVSHFTADSVPLLRGLVETASRTRKAFAYIDSPYELVPPGDILEVDEKGDLHGDVLVRPSRVKVAKRVEGAGDEAGSGQEES